MQYPNLDHVELTVSKIGNRHAIVFAEHMHGGKRFKVSSNGVERHDLLLDDWIKLPGHSNTGDTVVTLASVQGGRAVFRILAHNLIRVFRSELLQKDGPDFVKDEKEFGNE